jgi:serine protease Do
MRDPRRIFLLLVIGVLAGYAWWRYEHRANRKDTFTPATAPKINLDQVRIMAAIDEEYVRLIEAVVPSVVSITSSRTVLQPAPVTIEDLILGRQRAQKATSTSVGSGVIVSKEGHILTNHHVIAGMTEVRAQLSDGRNLAAKLIGSDRSTDLAVLKVEDTNLEPLPLGDSDNLRVGQQVFAVGNPYGLDETVTRGIVSAIGRRARSDSGVDAIQHDAAVNPGNSGGPLINIRGEIVGINSAIYTRTGGFQGISFAIPSNTVRRVLESIIARGRTIRPYLGVVMQNITPAIARDFGTTDTNGALIADVTPGSPADQAGLRPGDIVRTFAGKPIANVKDLDREISAIPIGTTAEVSIVRGGRTGRTSVLVAEMPQQLLQPDGR